VQEREKSEEKLGEREAVGEGALGAAGEDAVGGCDE
jgi:hypothetical protein